MMRTVERGVYPEPQAVASNAWDQTDEKHGNRDTKSLTFVFPDTLSPMTSPDTDWTAEESYRILRDAIDRCIAGSVSATALYDWMRRDYGVPRNTPPTHRANAVWGQAVLNVAVYLQCDMDRSVLVDSLQQIADWGDGVGTSGFTPITRSPCFAEMCRSGNVPAPLQVHTYESLRERRLRFEGFREI